MSLRQYIYIYILIDHYLLELEMVRSVDFKHAVHRDSKPKYVNGAKNLKRKERVYRLFDE